MEFRRDFKAFIKEFIQICSTNGLIRNYELVKKDARNVFMSITSKNIFKGIGPNAWVSFLPLLLRYKIIYKPVDLAIIVFDPFMLAAILIDPNFTLKTPKSRVVVNQSIAFKNMKVEKRCRICLQEFATEQSKCQHEENKEHVLQGIKISKDWHRYQNNNIFIEVKEGHANVPETIVCNTGLLSFILKVKNVSPTKIFLEDIVPVNSVLTVYGLIINPKEGVIEPKMSKNINISIFIKEERAYDFPLVLFIRHNNEQIRLVKQLIFENLPDSYKDLLPTAPYVKRKGVVKDIDAVVIAGEYPEYTTTFNPLIKLDQYKLPKPYIAVLNAGLKPCNVHEGTRLQIVKTLNFPHKKSLDFNNYCEMLDLLLFIEEHEMHINIRKYDMKEKLQLLGNNRFRLEVPELSEHRPSLVIGDEIRVKHDKHYYQGFVHKKNMDSVELGFNKSFKSKVYVQGKLYDISFEINRTVIKTEHQAVEIVKNHKLAQYFFPNSVPNNPIKLYSFKWCNDKIKNNEEQQKAVKQILSNTAFPYPYLIFGPPGTGKTMTVVEAIRQFKQLKSSTTKIFTAQSSKFYALLQIYTLQKDKNILVCTPSNNAANEINLRLKAIPTTDLLRYMSYSFPYTEIPADVKKYCNYNRQHEYYHPDIRAILKYRIVITTLTMAGKLYNLGTRKDHFNYVIIDESGHATETETLIAIAGILSSQNAKGLSGQIVLAGDPKQLGPIIHSPLAKSYGFDVSMLERLMNTVDVYKKHNNNKYDDKMVVKLLQNYRSHPEILKIPNDKFYDNELISKGNEFSNIAIGNEILRNKKFPMMFHCVIGKDEREATSPSFFNLQEVKVVVQYMSQLIGSRMQGVLIKEEHIGIITPYRKQVLKIRKACEKYKWEKVMIGSVEQLQGQEREIIIISTVRSKPEYVEHDYKYHLGFIKNPKRFNVAITRAKALVIVIGNGNLLQHDELWRAYIEACKNNNSFFGSPFALLDQGQLLKDSADDGLTSIFNQLNLQDGDDAVNFSRGNT